MDKCLTHQDVDATGRCRACSRHCCDECIGWLGICKVCWTKIVVGIFVVMVIASYSSWALLL
jgi:hypothetical protein